MPVLVDPFYVRDLSRSLFLSVLIGDVLRSNIQFSFLFGWRAPLVRLAESGAGEVVRSIVFLLTHQECASKFYRAARCYVISLLFVFTSHCASLKYRR